MPEHQSEMNEHAPPLSACPEPSGPDEIDIAEAVDELMEWSDQITRSIFRAMTAYEVSGREVVWEKEEATGVWHPPHHR